MEMIREAQEGLIFLRELLGVNAVKLAYIDVQ